jgi:uncharacterized protein (TIGR03086 family)
MTLDLGPATRRMADLIEQVPDDLLDGPTPCPAYTLGDLFDHVSGFALAFTGAARKAPVAGAPDRASGDASRLGGGWRSRLPQELDALAEAWRDPAAWTGMTRAGGIDLPGEIAGLVALDEVVVHGWDVARASGQAYACEPDLLEAVHDFLSELAVPGQEATREGIFGPAVPIPGDAPLLDRVIGLTGRDPAWSPR